MARFRRSYQDELRVTFAAVIDQLDLDAIQKTYLTDRWLDQVAWMEGKAGKAQRHYYRLRVTTVVGAVLLPGLIGLEGIRGNLGDGIDVATWVVSLVTAASAAIEGFFRFGERWRRYRGTAERLKSEGWLYFELSGPYRREGTTHASAYASLVRRVEELIAQDVDVYLTEVAVERERQGERPEQD